MAMLWDLNEGKHLYTLHASDPINALAFSPNRYWLCAATGPNVKIWVSYGILHKAVDHYANCKNLHPYTCFCDVLNNVTIMPDCSLH